MKKYKKISDVLLLMMGIVSFASVVGVNIAGLSVLIGIIGFFAMNQLEGIDVPHSGFDIKAIGKALRQGKLWFWILLPTVMNFAVVGAAQVIFPDYVAHVKGRIPLEINRNLIAVLVLQFAVLALGEEIAWRAFFQQLLGKYIPVAGAIGVTSVIFGVAHMATGTPLIVIYDLATIMINSIFYGIVFKKTNNAWVSGISHFIANVVAVIILFLV